MVRWLHPPDGKLARTRLRCHLLLHRHYRSDIGRPSEAKWTIRKSGKAGLLMKDA